MNESGKITISLMLTEEKLLDICELYKDNNSFLSINYTIGSPCEFTIEFYDFLGKDLAMQILDIAFD